MITHPIVESSAHFCGVKTAQNSTVTDTASIPRRRTLIPIPVSFETIQQLELALASGVMFKFSGDEDADVYLGSPIFASTLRTLLSAVIDYWTGEAMVGTAAQWRRSYTLSHVPSKLAAVRAYASKASVFQTMTRDERIEWLRVIAAPYTLDNESLDALRTLVGRP